MAKPLYIFDIDGTLALIDHRVSILDDKSDRNRWERFYNACDKDYPNVPVINVMNSLKLSGADIWLFTGRTESVREKTITWLSEHTFFMTWDLEPNKLLAMRPDGDYSNDDKLKEEWLESMLVEDRSRLVAVFEDRDRVVKMWRRNEVTCFQVATGNF